MPQDLLNATGKLRTKPYHISVKKSNFRLECMKQFYVMAEKDEHTLDIFLGLYPSITDLKTITFCNKRKKTEWLAPELGSRNLSFFAMHGDMAAFEHGDIMKAFRSDSAGLLIATDLLAHGIDLQQIPLVIL